MSGYSKATQVHLSILHGLTLLIFSVILQVIVQVSHVSVIELLL